jgi:hypothetical protein
LWFSVPEGVPSGSSFELRAGLYDPKLGPRLEMKGPSDNEARIRLGKVKVKPGDRLTSVPCPKLEPAIASRANTSGNEVDFGPIATSGGVRLEVEGQSVTVTPLPESHGRPLKVLLRFSALADTGITLTFAESIPENGETIKREPLRGTGGTLSLTCETGVFQYRLTRD